MKHEHRPKMNNPADGLFEYRAVEKKKLKSTIAITGIMMVAEFIGGLFTNSLALISDAGHMFTHFFALMISLGAIWCANMPSCNRRSYGFYRVEILAALLNSLFLFGVTVLILIEGIKRIIHPAAVLSGQMFIIAVIGLVVNMVSALILWGANKSDLNVRSAFLHMLADTMSSVVIVTGAVVIYFTNWNIIDPILSIGISFLIFVWGWGLFKDSVNILLESTPKGINYEEVCQTLINKIPEIDEISDLHIWTITSDMYSLTAHIRLKNSFNPEQEKELISRIKEMVNQHYNIEHTTIELIK